MASAAIAGIVPEMLSQPNTRRVRDALEVFNINAHFTGDLFPLRYPNLQRVASLPPMQGPYILSALTLTSTVQVGFAYGVNAFALLVNQTLERVQVSQAMNCVALQGLRPIAPYQTQVTTVDFSQHGIEIPSGAIISLFFGNDNQSSSDVFTSFASLFLIPAK